MKFLTGILLAAALAVWSGCGDDSEPPGGAGSSAAELAERGRVAFFDTLYGTADRGDEAIVALSQALALNPADGASYFRLGMIHMFRFARSVHDYRNTSAAQKEEIRLAHSALSSALPLVPEDRRIPGFRAAATYLLGFVTDDATVLEQGLQELRAAVALYPEFNNFDFIGVVGPTVSASDPLYQEVLQYVGDPLNGACSPFDQPEICGNAGKAAHNIEGALILFGDLFAKGGDARKARGYYTLAATPFSGAEQPWRFQAIIAERLSTVAQRVAAYKDADPTNDPPLIGYGEEACAVCHFK